MSRRETADEIRTRGLVEECKEHIKELNQLYKYNFKETSAVFVFVDRENRVALNFSQGREVGSFVLEDLESQGITIIAASRSSFLKGDMLAIKEKVQKAIWRWSKKENPWI